MISLEFYSVLGPLDLHLGDGCDYFCHYSAPLAATEGMLTFYLRQIHLDYLSPSDGGVGGGPVSCCGWPAEECMVAKVNTTMHQLARLHVINS